jgi:hypothetical protein
MSAVGGSSIDITINGRSFGISADADIAQSLKNYENEVRSNGDGSIRIIKKIVPQMLESLVLSIDDSNADMEFLSATYDSLSQFDFAVRFPSGVIYTGRGVFTGDMKRQTENAAAEVSISCKNMKRQS